jgi:hypothetical protein
MSATTAIQGAVNSTVYGAQKVIEGANAVKNDTDGFYRALKTSYYGCKVIEALVDTAKPMAQIAGGLNVIDFGDLIFVANYWINGEFITDAKEGRFCSILGTISMGGAIIGGAAMWLIELGFGTLSSVAAAMGSIPVFGAAVKAVAAVGLGPIVCVFVAIGYFCLAGDSLQTIIQSDVKEERIKAGIDLFSRVASAALYILMITPGVGVPVIIILGLVASGTGLSSFIYGHFTKNTIAEKKKPKIGVDKEKKIIKVQKYSAYKVEEHKIGDEDKPVIDVDHKKKVIRVNYGTNYTLITTNRGS